MITLLGMALCLLGVCLVGAAARRVWRTMVAEPFPTDADHGQRRNAAGFALHDAQHPVVHTVTFTRRGSRRRNRKKSK